MIITHTQQKGIHTVIVSKDLLRFTNFENSQANEMDLKIIKNMGQVLAGVAP